MQYEFIFLILGIWLVVLSFVVFLDHKFFRRLSKDVDTDNLTELIKKLLDSGTKNTKDIQDLEKKISQIKEDDVLHIQKVGLVRFNPFKELGGDHSFSLALLDANDTGIIITGLHTRERTSVYVKAVKKGTSAFDLSSEEMKVLKKAMKG